MASHDLADAGFEIRDDLDEERDRIALASRLILEQIGVEIAAPTDTHLEDMLRKFDGRFPTTRAFSEYARSTIPDVHPKDGADTALVAWMEREEMLFRMLERHLIADRIARGFGNHHMVADGFAHSFNVDVDSFIAFSLSVQNRRKSRVGYAFENHLECLFENSRIHYARTAITENRSRPDFLFPGTKEYADPEFNSERLTVLGVKSTCKDRWRQVLAEAERIENKHLLTLETAISTQQTDEMRAKQLQLVLPRPLHQHSVQRSSRGLWTSKPSLNWCDSVRHRSRLISSEDRRQSMVDTPVREHRSWNMSRIRGNDTHPELASAPRCTAPATDSACTGKTYPDGRTSCCRSTARWCLFTDASGTAIKAANSRTRRSHAWPSERKVSRQRRT